MRTYVYTKHERRWDTGVMDGGVHLSFEHKASHFSDQYDRRKQLAYDFENILYQIVIDCVPFQVSGST